MNSDNDKPMQHLLYEASTLPKCHVDFVERLIRRAFASGVAHQIKKTKDALGIVEASDEQR